MATLWVAMPAHAQHRAEGKLSIEVLHYVGDKPLIFDTVTYINQAGQAYTITKFKYYISNIALINTQGKTIALPGYYLVNEEEEESKKILLDHVPSGSYSSISFVIGVDSLHNCSGAQSGALDPVNAMFWAWNTGYIFLKLEGKAPVSASPGHIFEFHIGGYMQPANCIRTTSLTFKSPLRMGTGTAVLQLKADAAEVMKTPASIDLSKLSSVTDFHNATMIADNYADMFSIISQTDN